MLLSAIDTKSKGLRAEKIFKKTPSNFHLGANLEPTF